MLRWTHKKDEENPAKKTLTTTSRNYSLSRNLQLISHYNFIKERRGPSTHKFKSCKSWQCLVYWKVENITETYTYTDTSKERGKYEKRKHWPPQAKKICCHEIPNSSFNKNLVKGRSGVKTCKFESCKNWEC